MGHKKVQRKPTSKRYLSVIGTFVVIGVTFFLGFVAGLAVGMLL